MPLIVNPLAYALGAAIPYYRATGGSGPWTSVGATTGDTILRIPQSFVQPQINGLTAPVKGLDWLSSQAAEIEFTMLEFAGSKFGLVVPGATVTVNANTDTVGGTPGTTTLAAASVVGATEVTVAATTNFTVNDYVRIDVTAGGLAEYRQIDALGTSPARLQFRDPLLRAHASGVAAVETIGLGDTVITGTTTRRLPDSAYNDWVLVAQSGTDYFRLYLDNAISQTTAPAITFSDTAAAGVTVTLQGRVNGSATNLPAWRFSNPS